MRYAALAVPGFLAVFGGPAVPIDETCVELVAGQPVPAAQAVIVGQVCLEVQGSDLSIRFSAGDGWSMAETQLVVASSMEDIPRAGEAGIPNSRAVPASNRAQSDSPRVYLFNSAGRFGGLAW